MNLPNKIIKQNARKALLGKYPPSVSVTLLLAALSSLISYLMAISGFTPYGTVLQKICFWIMNLVALLIVSLLSIGLIRFFLNMTLEHPFERKDLFFCFFSDADRYILAAALRHGLLIIAWIPAGICYLRLPAFLECTAGQIFQLLILILFAIVLNLPVNLFYGQSYYILLEDENCSIISSMKKSRQLMHGHKWQLFLLYFSFLGYSLLELGTFGLGYLWLRPYEEMIRIQFYLNLCGRYSSNPNAS